MDGYSHDTCVVGAGITGLAIAHLLAARGERVKVLEAADAPGGVIQTRKIDGYLFDRGPNSTLAGSETINGFVDDLGLAARRRFANEQADQRFILRGGRLRLVPMAPPALLKSNLLSPWGKLRLLGDVFVRRSDPGAEETVSEFVRRRLGREALDYLINPFIAGVYAGDPNHLSARAAVSRVYELEQRYGGLIRGAIAKQKERKRAGGIDRTRARLFSFDEGMQVLTDTLAAGLGDAITTSTAVTGITPCGPGAGFAVTGRGPGEDVGIRARRVVLAVPAGAASQLIAPLDAAAGHALDAVPYARVAVVFQGYRTDHVPRPLDGFGFLVPKHERREILGSIWNSTLFPGRAPDGWLAMTTFVGGARQPANAGLDDEALEKLVALELHGILGIDAPAELTLIRRWERAIPQYTMGHGDRIAALEKAERRHAGLYVRGSFRGGISVGDCIDQAHRFVDSLSDAAGTGANP